MPVYVSSSRDVFTNLAIEELLLLQNSSPSPALLFYSNARAVVIGKHQNPWLECNTARISKDRIALARRISGGGAVYHDPGNLNYALIMERGDYDRDRVLSVIVAALSGLGLRADLRNTSSIFAEDRKVSGSAFCFKRGKVLHHGTLLVDSDLTMLAEVLKPSSDSLRTKAVRSIPAQVANLSALRTGLDRELCIDAITAAFEADLGIGALQSSLRNSLDQAKIEEVRQLRQQRDWIYGNTPKFKISWRRNNADSRELHLSFADGALAEITDTEGRMVDDPVFSDLIGRNFDEIKAFI